VRAQAAIKLVAGPHAATALLRRINGCEIPVWKT
jgi:hypothetical protein